MRPFDSSVEDTPDLIRWARFTLKRGPVSTAHLIARRIIGDSRPSWWSLAKTAFQGRRVVEIGGPSWQFGPKGSLPVYSEIIALDLVDYSKSVMEHPVQSGRIFRPARPKVPGRELIREATHLEGVPSSYYEGLLSSHVLEHIANPMLALNEWRRVVKKGSSMIIIVPNPEITFDRSRQITPVAHMQADFAGGTTEDDLTHVPEVLTMHDIELDPWARSRSRFVTLVSDNAASRVVHHHVFSLESLSKLVLLSGFDVIASSLLSKDDIAVMGRRPED